MPAARRSNASASSYEQEYAKRAARHNELTEGYRDSLESSKGSNNEGGLNKHEWLVKQRPALRQGRAGWPAHIPRRRSHSLKPLCSPSCIRWNGGLPSPEAVSEIMDFVAHYEKLKKGSQVTGPVL